MRPNTKRIYTSRIKVFERWLDDRKPTVEFAAEWLEHLLKTRKHNTVAISRNALVWKYHFALPSYSVEVPEPQYVELAQVKELIAKADPVCKAVISLMFDSSCRISEILNLRASDIEWDNGVITVERKGGHKQRVGLSPQGIEALKAWLKVRGKGARVFADWTYEDIRKAFKALGEKCGFAFHSHMLRHGRALHLLKSGVPLERVSDLLGHKSLEITHKVYGKLRAEDLKPFLVKW